MFRGKKEILIQMKIIFIIGTKSFFKK